MTLRPAPGTRLFFLDNEGILFSAPRQEVHRFNTTAAVIWCHLEDGMDEAGIAAALRADAGLTAADAARFVADALIDWQARHLLGPACPPEAPPPQPCLPCPRRPETITAAVTYRYRLMDSVLDVRFTNIAHAALADGALGHLRTAESPTTVLEVVGTPDGIWVYRDGIGQYGGPTVEEVAPMVLHQLWHCALVDSDYLAEFHAGVVAGPSGAVLLPGSAGSGKSTLTGALVDAGYAYYTDEVAVLGADLMLRPFPLPIALKAHGVPVLQARFPHLAALPVHLRSGDRKHVVYMPPPARSLPSADDRAAARGIVFPRYTAAAETKAVPLSSAETLQRLLGECRYVPHDLTLQAVRQLVVWVGTLPAVELVYSNLSEAVAYVRGIIGTAH